LNYQTTVHKHIWGNVIGLVYQQEKMQETLIFDGENHGFLQMFPSTCSKMVEQNPNKKTHQIF